MGGRYLELAAALRPELDTLDGFIPIERFESLAGPGKLLSLSFWRYEAAVETWRTSVDEAFSVKSSAIAQAELARLATGFERARLRV